MAVECKTLDQLTNEKERELLELRQQKSQALEEALKSIHNKLTVERQKVTQLQSDFDYNLTLLKERDLELARYESVFVEVKRVVNTLLAENSELKVCVDGLRGEVEKGKMSLQQMKAHYVKRIEDLHSQMDAYRCSKQNEVDLERSKLEQLQRELEHRLIEVEGDMQCQRDQLSHEFDELMKQREHEHQLRVTELSSSLLARESEVKKLTRELKLAQSANSSGEEDRKEKEEEVVKLRKELQQQQWRMEDESSCFEARLAELQGELTHIQTLAKSQQQDFEKRHAELDRLVREKEASLKAAREAHHKKEASLQQQLAIVRAEFEKETRRLQWERDDVAAEKAKETQRLSEELVSCKASCDSTVNSLSQEIVSKDLKIQAQQDTIDKVQDELAQRNTKIDHYKHELQVCQERATLLEQSKAQLQLDWEQRVTELEREAYSKHQHIIQQLSSSRDKLGSECKELKSSLERMTSHLRKIQRDRDVAIATLNKHGLAGDSHMTDHMTDVQKLQEQNKELHTVIRQMREDMEQLQNPSNRMTANEHITMPTTGYIQYMESEVIRLKSENRQLLERLQRVQPSSKPPTPQRSLSPPPVKKHQSHLIALSDTIASLQREKHSLETENDQLKKKLGHLEKSLADEKEKMYAVKACQVPESKLHQKLLQATKVIIALVKEKEQLKDAYKQNSEENHGSVTVEKSVQVSLQQIAPPEKHRVTREADSFLARATPRETVSTPKEPIESVEGGINNRDTASRRSQRHISTSHSSPTVTEHGVDISLSSLQFTDSSIGGESIQQVLQMVEKEHLLGDGPIHQSTPEPEPGQLELVGSVVIQQKRRTNNGQKQYRNRLQPRKPVARRVRNYNVKD